MALDPTECRASSEALEKLWGGGVSDGYRLDVVCWGTEGRGGRLFGMGSMDRSSGDEPGPQTASVSAAERRMNTLDILGEDRLPPSCTLEYRRNPVWFSSCVAVEWQVCE